MTRRASVIGSGPNGLAAAIVLARAGLQVDVYEAETQPGGATRTMELTLPGFRHDFGSAVHPMGAGSPFFSSLPLAKFGLQWVHGTAPLAHPLDDGTAVTLEHSLKDQETVLGVDGREWREMVGPLAQHWTDFAIDALGPVTRIPRRPLLMANFGRYALQPARSLAMRHFKSERTRALLAGLAAHSFLNFDEVLSAAVGLALAGAAHAVGWPVARGGSQAIADALIGYLRELGGTVHSGRRIVSLDELDGNEGPGDGPILCDLTPRQLLGVAGDRLQKTYRKAMEEYRYGPAVFKVDYALSAPIPWKARECSRSITVHVGGTLEEIADSEDAVTHGRIAERPFMLVAQPTLFDATRAPAGKHVAWVYCHVPNGCTVDMMDRIEAQLERFAPGFRDCVLARHTLSPAQLEQMDANLVGGDINGGALSMGQFVFRPALGNYYTGTKGLYLCSSSTPPSGGVHGMCGFHAATMALRRM
ncbi:MAG TPA: NAD(P)/FAD-dependent oxidoreductase [Acidobacteriaceae bacterium]|jgi:phytoene dehydrogenase-like protein|nr:NAD(P)/FAD-dependent oxidoreductase [Acidobacteriaceae bacterium]